jgi:hypothetical protein
VKLSGQGCGFWKNMKLALKHYGKHSRKAKTAASRIIAYLALLRNSTKYTLRPGFSHEKTKVDLITIGRFTPKQWGTNTETMLNITCKSGRIKPFSIQYL